MPLYEYRCESCGHRFEVIQRFSDPPVAVCPACGAGPVVKLLSSPAIQFKGSGWYITDYARKGQDGGEKKDAGPTAKKESTSKDSTASDAASKPADTSSSAASTPKDG